MRSLLFVPAKTKMLEKIGQCRADAYIIDLEDSILQTDKDKALTVLRNWLNNNEQEENIYVRINKERYEGEIDFLLPYNIGFMLPKFEKENDYSSRQEALHNRETIALIETPQGMLNIRGIVECDWIKAIAFGAEDYSSAIDMDNNNELMLFPKQMLVLAAKSRKKPVYDTPSFSYRDEGKLRQDVDWSVRIGFDGKLAIHPSQINVINAMFSSYDVENAKRIVASFEATNDGVVVVDGVVYEKMHIDRLKRIIKRVDCGIK